MYSSSASTTSPTFLCFLELPLLNLNFTFSDSVDKGHRTRMVEGFWNLEYLQGSLLATQTHQQRNSCSYYLIYYNNSQAMKPDSYPRLVVSWIWRIGHDSGRFKSENLVSLRLIRRWSNLDHVSIGHDESLFSNSNPEKGMSCGVIKVVFVFLFALSLV